VDVEEAVADYFERSGLSARDVPRMYAKTAVILVWLAASYIGLVFAASSVWSALALAISLGLAMAAVGFNIQHDASHGAYSDRPFVNRALSLSLDLLGGSSYFWSFKHNRAHHTYPNIAGADDDLVVGALGRLSPQDRWYPAHRLQRFYMWFLYAFLAIRWQLIDDFHSMIDPGIGMTRVRRPRGWDQARFWLGKAVFFGLGLGLPSLFHDFWLVLPFYLIVNMTLGLALAVVFQLAHCVEEAAFPQPVDGRIQRDWAVHQLDTTVNFGRGNRLVTWFTGGLNYQVEHHLFPRICHVHYPAVADIVQTVAARHGIPYRSNPSMSAALRSHYRFLRRMGRPPAIAPHRATATV
jgi:linoleoyl-CoA desaturase